MESPFAILPHLLVLPVKNHHGNRSRLCGLPKSVRLRVPADWCEGKLRIEDDGTVRVSIEVVPGRMAAAEVLDQNEAPLRPVRPAEIVDHALHLSARLGR